MTTYRLSHLDELEAEAIHIIREVVAEFEKPALLFSGGKDSAVLLALAVKACWPQRLPFPVVHVDTGHNFPEVIAYRDHQVESLNLRLVVGSVQHPQKLGKDGALVNRGDCLAIVGKEGAPEDPSAAPPPEARSTGPPMRTRRAASSSICFARRTPPRSSRSKP